jgi:alpha-amylase/alpha-mannosidase (GH57 family)
MPWVRLHGVKDYWGMAMLLKEVPELHATINLVPSLLVQLLGYTEHNHEDRHLRISRMPADSLSADDMVYLMDNFFMVHPDHMIRPYRRYHELYKKRGVHVDPPDRAAKRFTHRDVLDLQCWSNLSWFHPLAFELDADLAEFRKKGRNWTESEKLWLLDKQMAILRQVIPLHRELQQQGQVELTTTPFYHPILPLLYDKRLARRAMPDVRLPNHLEGYPEDAQQQIRWAVEFHEKTFGQKPRGMWPSEGSVCQGIIPAIADAGIQWIATDEEILSSSTDGAVCRDGNGYLRNPEMLYRPWRVEENGRQLQVLFRDHAMSDMIGFNYQRYSAEHAVNDFIGKIEAIGRATSGNAGRRPTLVSVILDGENCWEYYQNSGVDFLRKLYHQIALHPKIAPVRVTDYLQRHPATDKLAHLFPGSWIQHNFAIWIGHPECNQAWDLLHQTRQHLKASASRNKSPEQLQQAWRELYIAEGSDWFWWFGDSHTSAQDNLFDHLFRRHLQNVYTLLGDQPPAELARPISQASRQRLHTLPTGLLNVRVDGRRTYFEWINAGHYACQGSRGTMSMNTEGLIADLYFGSDAQRLFVRLDAQNGSCRERLANVDQLRMVFLRPEGFELVVTNPAQRQPHVQFCHNGVPVAEAGVEAAGDVVFELAIPFRSLAVSTNAPLAFYLELLKSEQSIERLPTEAAIEMTVPSEDFELIMWQA